jgi:hypothetical protein
MSDKGKSESSGTTEAIGFGCALAIVISFTTHQSIIWAILHGMCSWFYVIYYAITR